MESNHDSIQTQWGRIQHRLKDLFGKKPDVNAALFLIGVQELGKGSRPFSKEEKQDLMHIATCKVLSFSGYYKLLGQSDDGWPIWENTKPIPNLSVKEQDLFLKSHISEYFEKEVFS